MKTENGLAEGCRRLFRMINWLLTGQSLLDHLDNDPRLAGSVGKRLLIS